jgi:hypothetical protein
MKNFECSNSDDRRSDRNRLSFLAIFSIVLFGLLFLTENLSSQSLGSQLKIIFGDALTTYGKNDFSRFVGKSLSTSGNMQYNMEMIKAQSNQTLNINLPPNTYMSQNNQVLPNQGYQWANPSNSSDYSVMPLNSYATLPPYDLYDLQNRYNKTQGAWVFLGTTLSTLFTYNWVSDINGNGILTLNEFNNIKRTFRVGETVSFAFEFIAQCGKRFSKDIGDNVSFLMQIFNNLNGNLIAKGTYSFHDGGGPLRSENKFYSESLGNSLPPGIYLISVSISFSDRLTRHTITSLSEYFEVIE